MTTNISYAFVSGPPESIQQSWEQFDARALNGAGKSDVQVIPAMGGCFFVLTEGDVSSRSMLRRPLSWLHAGKKGHVTAAQLQSFKEAFESPAIKPACESPEKTPAA